MASIKQFQVTFDCAEPERVARFWCEVLGYVVPPPPEGLPLGPISIARCRLRGRVRRIHDRLAEHERALTEHDTAKTQRIRDETTENPT
ncbi:MAG: hypothetical protein JWQ81_2680 [Amycolatopsis sp.]|nr:VOC family protein [Amycolatopsis sp.]MCU1681941.1 hypothetical protein [Amycolatopsis sp.]